MADEINVVVNETTEIIEVTVSDGNNGAGSINEPTGSGGFLRTSIGGWIKGVPESVYNLFVSKYPTTATNGKILQGDGTAYVEVDMPPTDLSGYATTSQLGDKVDKVTGKGLSTEDYTTIEKNKLAGIANGATLNSTDETLLNRSNHTGTQLSSTISDFSTTVNGLIVNKVNNTTTINTKPLSSNITLNQDDIIDGTTNVRYSLIEKNKLASITEIFTTALKTAYDNTVTWVSTNGSNILSHLSNTANPHNVTTTQIGAAPINNPTFTGTVTLAQNATSYLQAVPLQQLRSEEIGWNKIVLFGDSRIANESATVSNITYNYNRGVINWANAILDKRFEIVANKGVGGNTTANLLSRYDTDIKPYAGIVKIIYMMIDVNDVNADVPEATIKANLTSLYDKMAQDGFYIIDTLGYYPVSAFTLPRQRVFQNISQFKRVQAHSRRNLRVLDCHAIIGNVTLTSPTTNANMMFDGTLHIGVRASQLLGIELAKILAPLCPTSNRLINSAGDFRTTSDNTISKNLLLNPLMLGTAGANHPSGGTQNDVSVDAGFTAGVTSGFTARRQTGTGTANMSVGTNTNFLGQVQRIKITGETTATATYQFAPTNSVHSIVTKGVPLIARCKVQLSNIAFVHTVMLRVLFTVDGVTYGSRDMADSNYVGGAITKDCILTLETLPITISGTSVTVCEAQIFVIFDNTTSRTGTLTLDVGQFSFEELA